MAVETQETHPQPQDAPEPAVTPVASPFGDQMEDPLAKTTYVAPVPTRRTHRFIGRIPFVRNHPTAFFRAATGLALFALTGSLVYDWNKTMNEPPAVVSNGSATPEPALKASPPDIQVDNSNAPVSNSNSPVVDVVGSRWTVPPDSLIQPPVILFAQEQIYASDIPSRAINGWGPAEKDMSNGGENSGDGHMISLNGTKFPKGIGLHASAADGFPTTVTYKLPRSCSSFESDIGIDDEVAKGDPAGSVVFQMIGDQGLLYESGVITEENPIHVRVGIQGINEVQLRILDGGDGTVNDHADLAGATFTCNIGSILTASRTAILAPSSLEAPPKNNDSVDNPPAPDLPVGSKMYTEEEFQAARDAAAREAAIDTASRVLAAPPRSNPPVVYSPPPAPQAQASTQVAEQVEAPQSVAPERLIPDVPLQVGVIGELEGDDDSQVTLFFPNFGYNKQAIITADGNNLEDSAYIDLTNSPDSASLSQARVYARDENGNFLQDENGNYVMIPANFLPRNYLVTVGDPADQRTFTMWIPFSLKEKAPTPAPTQEPPRIDPTATPRPVDITACHLNPHKVDNTGPKAREIMVSSTEAVNIDTLTDCGRQYLRFASQPGVNANPKLLELLRKPAEELTEDNRYTIYTLLPAEFKKKAS
jgi:hypothetical protein